MLIRPYLEPDETAVIALWQACGLTRPWNDPHRDIARKLQVQRELFLVGEVDGRLVASVMAGYDGHRGWVNYLAVHPHSRGLGHGQALMQHVERLLLAQGCPKLNLQVRAGNADALAFYRRIGYLQDEVFSLGRRLIPDTPPAHGAAASGWIPPSDAAAAAAAPVGAAAGSASTVAAAARSGPAPGGEPSPRGEDGAD